MQGLFSTSFHSNQSQGGPQGISKRQQVSSKTTLDLERRAQDLKDTAKRARAQGWSQIAIQAVDQEAKQARAAWENSYRADEDVDINRKRDQAQHFKNNAKTARQSGLGPLAIAAAEKEADDAYRVYEQAYQETARRRRHFANVSLFPLVLSLNHNNSPSRINPIQPRASLPLPTLLTSSNNSQVV